MARKIQFDVTATPPATPEPASRAPAMSGMARSLHAAAAAAVRDIDPRLIDDSRFADRLDPDDAEIDDLADSIRSQGQLIPILVSPIAGGRFRIVYGRRRLAALRRLALPAKALVREMDEDQAIIAQGQENTYRRDLTWIEKAVFAQQLIAAGKSDDLVCDALNIDQKARKMGEKLTGLSRMKQVTARIPATLIEAIGPAPKVGRDRWYALAQTIEKTGFPAGNLDALAKGAAQGMSSDDRFDMADRLTRRPRPPAPRAPGGQVRVNHRTATITITAADAADLHAWIAAHPDAALSALHDAQKRFTPP